MCVTTGQLALPKERTTGLECVPEGKTVSYECTVNDPTGNGSTVWLGSAFNCSDSEIVLSHSVYSGVGVSGVCAGVSAQSVSENGTEFTSTLTLTATAQLNGTTINCTLNGMVSFGWETIRVCSVSCDPRELGDNITHSNDSGTASVPNGVVVFNGTEIGSVARLICDDGLSPSGPVIRMCVSSGNWSGQSQSCGVLPMPTPLLWLISFAVVPAGFIMICYSLCCVCYKKKKRGTALPDSDVEHAAGLQVNHPDITLSDTIQNNVPNPAGSKSGVSNTVNSLNNGRFGTWPFVHY